MSDDQSRASVAAQRRAESHSEGGKRAALLSRHDLQGQGRSLGRKHGLAVAQSEVQRLKELAGYLALTALTTV